MAQRRSPAVKVETFPDHHVITQPNPLRRVLRRVDEHDLDDPVARAEKALQSLSGEFKNWMAIECDRLSAAHDLVRARGFNTETRNELFRAAHDIKGDAATFGYPIAGSAADSLCRLIEHAPDLNAVPPGLIQHHIDAVLAIVREHSSIDAIGVADALTQKLRNVTDEYLSYVNRDRPDHLEAVMAPSIVPAE
jgi:chemotaxis protein histidine kinase CheA